MAESTDPRDILQTKAFTAWANSHLTKRQKFIKSMTEDLKDGLLFISLIEILDGREFSEKYEKTANRRIERLSNAQAFLRYLDKVQVKLVGVNPDAIVDGNQKMLLATLWALIRRYQIQAGSGDGKETNAARLKKDLLEWTQKQLSPYKRAQVSNFTSSFQDGYVLCALVDSLNPGVMGMESLGSNVADNLEKAFSIAETQYAIPRLLFPSDIAEGSIDEQSVMTYVSYFRNAAPQNTAQPHKPEPEHEPDMASRRLSRNISLPIHTSHKDDSGEDELAKLRREYEKYKVDATATIELHKDSAHKKQIEIDDLHRKWADKEQDYQHKLGDSQTKYSKLELELDRLRKESQNPRDSAADAGQLHADIEALRRQNADLGSKLSGAEQDNKQSKDQLAKLQAERAQNLKDLDELKQKLDHNNRDWKQKYDTMSLELEQYRIQTRRRSTEVGDAQALTITIHQLQSQNQDLAEKYETLISETNQVKLRYNELVDKFNEHQELTRRQNENHRLDADEWNRKYEEVCLELKQSVARYNELVAKYNESQSSVQDSSQILARQRSDLSQQQEVLISELAQWKARNLELASKLSESQATAKILEQQLTHTNQEWKHKYDTLSLELEQNKSQSKEHALKAGESQTLTITVQQLQLQNHDLVQKYETLISETNQVKLRYNELVDKFNEHQELTRQQNEKHRLDADEWNRKYEEVCTELKQTIARYNELVEEYNESQYALQSLEALHSQNKSDATQRYEVMVLDLSQLKAQNLELVARLSESQAMCKSLEKVEQENKEWSLKYESLTIELTQWKSRYNELNSQLNESHGNSRTLESQLQQSASGWSIKYETVAAELVQWKARHAELTAKLGDTLDKVRSLENQLQHTTTSWTERYNTQSIELRDSKASNEDLSAKLKEALERIQSLEDELRETISSWTGRYNTLSDELALLKSQNAGLTSDLDSCYSSRKSVEDELEQVTRTWTLKYETLSVEFNSATLQITKLTGELDSSRATAKALEQQLSQEKYDWAQKYETLSNELTASKAQIAELNLNLHQSRAESKSMRELEEESEEWKRKYHAIAADLLQWKARNAELGAELNEYKQKSMTLESQLQQSTLEWTLKYELATNELAQWKSQSNQLAANLSEAQVRIKSLEQQNMLTINGWTLKYDALNSELANSKKLILELSAKLTEYQASGYSPSKGTTRSLPNAADSMKEYKADSISTDELTQWKARNAELTLKLVDLQSYVHDLEAQLKQANAELESRNTTISAEIDHVKEINVTREEVIQKLEAQVAALEKEKHELEEKTTSEIEALQSELQRLRDELAQEQTTRKFYEAFKNFVVLDIAILKEDVTSDDSLTIARLADKIHKYTGLVEVEKVGIPRMQDRIEKYSQELSNYQGNLGPKEQEKKWELEILVQQYEMELRNRYRILALASSDLWLAKMEKLVLESTSSYTVKDLEVRLKHFRSQLEEVTSTLSDTRYNLSRLDRDYAEKIKESDGIFSLMKGSTMLKYKNGGKGVPHRRKFFLHLFNEPTIFWSLEDMSQKEGGMFQSTDYRQEIITDVKTGSSKQVRESQNLTADVEGLSFTVFTSTRILDLIAPDAETYDLWTSVLGRVLENFRKGLIGASRNVRLRTELILKEDLEANFNPELVRLTIAKEEGRREQEKKQALQSMSSTLKSRRGSLLPSGLFSSGSSRDVNDNSGESSTGHGRRSTPGDTHSRSQPNIYASSGSIAEDGSPMPSSPRSYGKFKFDSQEPAPEASSGAGVGENEVDSAVPESEEEGISSMPHNTSSDSGKKDATRRRSFFGNMNPFGSK